MITVEVPFLEGNKKNIQKEGFILKRLSPWCVLFNYNVYDKSNHNLILNITENFFLIIRDKKVK